VRDDFPACLGRYLQSSADPLRSGALLLSALIFLAGLVLLGYRLRAALRGLEPSRSLAAHRMTAVLGALGGFVAYLRDLPRSGGRCGLVAGGISAAPWAAVILLELLRRWRARAPGPDRQAPG
jgi:hypothetical protein